MTPFDVYRENAKPLGGDKGFPKSGESVYCRENGQEFVVVFVWREKMNPRDQRITVQKKLSYQRGASEVLFVVEFWERFSREKPEEVLYVRF